MATSLERYLTDAMAKGVTKHRLVASRTADGLVAFFIHAEVANGSTRETRQFITYDAAVVPRNDGGPAVAVALAAGAQRAA